MSEDSLDIPDDLISQLKENTNMIKQLDKKDNFELDKKDLEQFILNSSGKLISDSLRVLDEMRDFVEAAPDAETISSLAALMKASTDAIDTLNKVLIQDKKSTTSITTKQMDIEAKKELAGPDKKGIMTLTRGEIVKKLLKEADVIEIEEI